MRFKQRGSLLIAAVMLMTVMALIAGTIAYLFVDNAESASNQGITTEAFYLAQAGLSAGLAAIETKPMANTSGTASRIACTAMNGNASYTNVALGAGTFTVTGTRYMPTPATLSAAITTLSTVIPMTSVSGYASMGTVIIENELIDYGSLGTSATQCGTGVSACLLGVTHGANGSTAAAHASGIAVVQSLCELQATGGVPSVASPKASRTIKQTVMFASPQSVGAVSGGDLIQYWAGSTWTNMGPSAGIGSYALNSLDFIHSSNGWSVGNVTTSSCTSSSRSLYVFYNGSTWSPVCSTNVNQMLYGVSCAGTAFCKAVGATNTSLSEWNGSSWSQDASNSSMPSVTYNAVDCPSTSFCVAVGNALTTGTPASLRYEVVLTWSGGAWSRVSSGAIGNNGAIADTTNFLGIDCPSATFCVVVGSGPVIAFYNSGTWSSGSVAGIPAVQYNGVSCVTASDCWAVGNVSTHAVFIHWNGTAWSQTVGAGVPAQNMLSVKCMATDACWAVGANGAAAFWNGTVWANASTGNPAVSINAVSALIGSYWKDRVFAWREVFN
ncbi:MAG: hypothetical protein ACHQAX_03480 [Gammaproteobacteria bacterium]